MVAEMKDKDDEFAQIVKIEMFTDLDVIKSTEGPRRQVRIKKSCKRNMEKR